MKIINRPATTTLFFYSHTSYITHIICSRYVSEFLSLQNQNQNQNLSFSLYSTHTHNKFLHTHTRHTSAPGIFKIPGFPGLTTSKNADFPRFFSHTFPGFPESRQKLRFFPGGRISVADSCCDFIQIK